MSTLVELKKLSSSSLLHYAAIGPDKVNILSVSNENENGCISFWNGLSHHAFVFPVTRIVVFEPWAEFERLPIDNWLPFTTDGGYDPIFLTLSFYV